MSVSTVRRLYKEHGLDRIKLDTADGRVRLRWQANRADALMVKAMRDTGCRPGSLYLDNGLP